MPRTIRSGPTPGANRRTTRAVPPARTPTSGRARHCVSARPRRYPTSRGPSPAPTLAPHPGPTLAPNPAPDPARSDRSLRPSPRLPALDHAGVGGSAGRLATVGHAGQRGPARPTRLAPTLRGGTLVAGTLLPGPSWPEPSCRDPPGGTLRGGTLLGGTRVALGRAGPRAGRSAGIGGRSRIGRRTRAGRGPCRGDRFRPARAADRVRSGRARTPRPTTHPRRVRLGRRPRVRPARHLRLADRTDRSHRPTDRCGAADRIRPPVGAVGPARTGATRHLRRPRTSARLHRIVPAATRLRSAQPVRPAPPARPGGRATRPTATRPAATDQRRTTSTPATNASTTSTRTTTTGTTRMTSTTGHRAGTATRTATGRPRRSPPGPSGSSWRS